MMHGVLVKLPDIKADLVTRKPGWQGWGLRNLMGSLEKMKAIRSMETLAGEKLSETPPIGPI